MAGFTNESTLVQVRQSFGMNFAIFIGRETAYRVVWSIFLAFQEK